MDKCDKSYLLPVPVIPDATGNLSFIQHPGLCPFEIKRVFYMFDLPEGSHRGGHSHFHEEQLIIAAAGSFTVSIDNGRQVTRYTLDARGQALYVPPRVWRSIDDFTAGSLCLVLSSTEFDEADYVRDYTRFIELISHNND